MDRTRRLAREWLTGLASRFVASVMRRPWSPILSCAALALAGAFFATRLELRTRFDQLLPDGQASVVELRRVQDRVATTQNVFIVLEGPRPADLRAMGDALCRRLADLGEPWVASVKDGVQDARAFLESRAAMFATPEALQRLKQDVDARWDWELSRLTDSRLDDDPPPPIGAEEVRARLGTPNDERFPDGYYQAKDGRALLVAVRSALPAGELGRARETLQRIQAVVGVVARDARFTDVHVGYAGDLVTGLAEYGAVRDDLVSVGAIGVTLVLGAVFAFFMRVRVLLAMGLTIGAALAMTFGLTEIAIGHLNVATGFLFSIVAGNGINFGIIYMARYYEAVRGGGSSEHALRAAYVATWSPTLTASLAAAASYGSLGVTHFRAFRHFAFIGAMGMIVCWVVTYAMLPALLLLFERARPFSEGVDERTAWGRLRLHGLRYDRPFSFALTHGPRTFALAGAAVAAAGFLALGPYLRADPMEYDMRHLQNDMGSANKEMYRVSALAADLFGAKLENSMLVLTDSADQALELKHTLEARRDGSPSDEKPFEAAHTLFDYVPSDQEVKLPIVQALRERLVRAHERGFIGEDDWTALQRVLPSADLRPWTIGDLPEDLARPFTERDGTRGRLVLIEPTAGKSDADLRYLLRWADSFRETRLRDGAVVRGSGRAVIFADMLEAIKRDMPRAVVVSLSVTVLAVMLLFGGVARAAPVLGSLGVGLGWIAFAMATLKLKIDFFNFIALPITFGIGVDYAVNFVQRYREGLPGGVLDVIRRTGGPVVLCSLTTTLGYLALCGSVNRAVRGLGLLAVFGEVACLFAAVLVLPAALLGWRRLARLGSTADARGDDSSARPGRPKPAVTET